MSGRQARTLYNNKLDSDGKLLLRAYYESMSTERLASYLVKYNDFYANKKRGWAAVWKLFSNYKTALSKGLNVLNSQEQRLRLLIINYFVDYNVDFRPTTTAPQPRVRQPLYPLAATLGLKSSFDIDNNPATNPYIPGIVPEIPEINEEYMSESVEYRMVVNRIKELKSVITRVFKLNPNIRKLFSFPVGVFGTTLQPIATDEYWEMEARIQSMLQDRNHAIAELNQQLNRLEALEEEFNPVLYLRMPNMLAYVRWRINIDNINFPLQRTAQNVTVNYVDVVIDENTREYLERSGRRGFEDRNSPDYSENILENYFWETVDLATSELQYIQDSSQRAVNYLYKKVNVRERGIYEVLDQTISGCVKYFYSNVLRAFLAHLNLNPRGATPLEGFISLRTIANMNPEDLVQFVSEYYEIDEETAYALTLRIQDLFLMISNRHEGNLMTPIEIARRLTNIYTKSTYRGYVMNPIYSKSDKDCIIYSLGFIARFKLTEDQTALRALNNRLRTQYNILTAGSVNRPTFEEFMRKIRNPRTKIVSILAGYFYNNETSREDVRGEGLFYVHNNPEVYNVDPGFSLPNVGVYNTPNLTVGQQGLALGIETTLMQNPRRPGLYRRYFGDSKYKIGYTAEQKSKWFDNSSSGNLCAITSLVYDRRAYEIITNEMPIEEFIGLVTISEGMDIDERLYPQDRKGARSIFRLIMKWLASRMPEKLYLAEVSLTEKVKEGSKVPNRSKKVVIYKYSDDCLIPIKVSEYENDKDSKYIFNVFFYESHIYNCTDEEQLNYLVEYFKSPGLKLKLGTQSECLYNTAIVTAFRESLNQNKHLLTAYPEFLQVSYNKEVLVIPSDIIKRKDEILLRRILGDRVGKKLMNKLYQKATKTDLYCYFDFETVMIEGLSRVHTVCFSLEYEGKNILDYCVSWLGKKYSESLENMVIKTFFDQIDKQATKIAERERLRFIEENGLFELEEDEVPLYYPKVKVFAHNAGRFDTILLRDIMVRNSNQDFSRSMRIQSSDVQYLPTDIKHEMQGVRKYVPCSDIICGGSMKSFKVGVYYGLEGLKYNVVFIDSLNLLQCPLANIAHEYNLPAETHSKGEIPHKFYTWILNYGDDRMVWTREELLRLQLPVGIREDLDHFLSEFKGDVIDFATVCREYCMQDVKVLQGGINSAHNMYHQIKVPGGILQDEYGLFLVITTRGEKYMRLRFKDSITLPGFAKKLALVTSLGYDTMTSKTLSHLYFSCYTGGVTYMKKVHNFISSKMEDIATNKYFYIPSKDKEMIKLFVKYGYDVNKRRKTYNPKNPPKEVLQLKEDMRNCNDSCLYLVDSNSLYPASIHKMGGEDIGGFPAGEMKIMRDAEHMKELLNQNKRFIFYAKIEWTDRGIEEYNKSKLEGVPLMHHLVLKTDEGGRYLTPEDRENSSYGMTDVRFRSILETDRGFYEIKFLSGIYWENTSSSFSDLIEGLYQERLKWKAQGSEIQSKVKLIMNSSYGFSLEKCHYMKSAYVETKEPVRIETEQFYDPVSNNISTRIKHTQLESDITKHQLNSGSISDYNQVSNFFTRVETLDMSSIRNYESLNVYGAFTLDMAKKIMNLLFSKLYWDVMYTDTDSGYMSNQSYFRIKNEDPEFISNMLGAFKSDFDAKFLGKPFCYDGVVSVASIFLAKKVYCNVLFGTKEADNGEVYLTVQTQTAGKGVVHQALGYSQYERLLDNNNVLIQDRVSTLNKPVFKINEGAKSCKGISVYTKTDYNRPNFRRTIRNQNAIRLGKKKDRPVNIETQGYKILEIS